MQKLPHQHPRPPKACSGRGPHRSSMNQRKDKFLTRYFSRVPLGVLSMVLGLSVPSVRYHARRLGLPPKHRRGQSAYQSWSGMKARCRNPNRKAYVRYGGRGITVCDRWLGPEGFRNFMSDMGNKPSPDHSIDRIDNDGNYEPGNCRWADAKTQGRTAKRHNGELCVDCNERPASKGTRCDRCDSYFRTLGVIRPKGLIKWASTATRARDERGRLLPMLRSAQKGGL